MELGGPDHDVKRVLQEKSISSVALLNIFECNDVLIRIPVLSPIRNINYDSRNPQVVDYLISQLGPVVDVSRHLSFFRKDKMTVITSTSQRFSSSLCKYFST